MLISEQQKRFWSPLVRELEPYIPGEQPKIANLLKLNTNENPYPPSPKVAQAIQKLLEHQADCLKLYPDPDASELKQTIAQYYALDVNHVFVGNGSDEVLAHIFKAFFVQDKPLLYPDISYSFYPVYSQLFEVQTQPIALDDDFSLNVQDYNVENGGIIITNPNASTGKAISLAEIEQLLQNNPNSVVVIDEAYVDFGAESTVQLIEKYDNLVVCQTTSKSRSLAGLRVGYAMAQPHLITALETVKNSFNSYPLDRFAIAGAVASFQDDDYFKKCCQQVIENRELLVKQLTELGFDVLPSKANFIFARHTQNASEIAQKLRVLGIIVRYFNKPRIDQFLRITIGTQEQNQRLVDGLKSIL